MRAVAPASLSVTPRGTRVPAIVISKYAKKGYVGQTAYDTRVAIAIARVATRVESVAVPITRVATRVESVAVPIARRVAS